MIALAKLRSWCWPDADPPPESARSTALPEMAMFDAMEYRFAPQKHPEFKEIYLKLAMRELPQRLALERVGALFGREKIRFAPFKGAYLADACYPDPALRSKCDIDILVPPEDLERARKTLEADGWRAPYCYKHQHHTPSMFKQGVMLELHFSLPRLSRGDAERLWELMIPDKADFRHHLPPELELLALFNHSFGHDWSNGVQMLADAGFLLGRRGAPDWDKLGSLAREFRMPGPELLFFAFPDFFPGPFMPPGAPPDRESAALLRRIILHPVDLRGNRDKLVMNRTDRFTFSWWRDRLSGFRPSAVRMTARLPGRGAYGRLAAAYVRVFSEKLRLAARGLRGSGDPTISALRDIEKLAEKFQKHRDV